MYLLIEVKKVLFNTKKSLFIFNEDLMLGFFIPKKLMQYNDKLKHYVCYLGDQYIMQVFKVKHDYTTEFLTEKYIGEVVSLLGIKQLKQLKQPRLNSGKRKIA